MFCFALIFTRLFQSYCSAPSSDLSIIAHSAANYITLDFDKTKADVGDIIKASVRIDGSNIIAGYQICITYDPEVLQAVNPDTGKAYNSNTKPLPGNILINEEYKVLTVAINDINKGVLIFGRTYLEIEAYKKSGIYEASGILDIIGFKVISPYAKNTQVCFTDNPQIPGGISGTYLYNADNQLLSSYHYYVLQPNNIYLNENVTPTPPPTPKNYKLSGFIKPDVETSESTSPNIKADFIVSLSMSGGTLNTTTDSNGYFEFNNVPLNPSGYSLIIRKESYLCLTPLKTGLL